MSRTTESVIVVGGGVIGVCAAYYLTRRGARVTLVERGEIAGGASHGNAGVIAVGHGPMNKPGRLRQALKWMGDPTSPLYIPPHLDRRLLAWLWAFHRRCTHQHVDAAMGVLGPLGLESRRLFDELLDEESLKCGFRPDGYYEVCRTEEGLKGAAREAEWIRSHGFQARVLGAGAMLEREPALKPGVVGAVFFPESASLDPRRFVLEMADRSHRLGATLRSGWEAVALEVDGTRVLGVRNGDGELLEAQATLLATGAYSEGLLRSLGVGIPIQAAKGYHRDWTPTEGDIPPPRTTCMLAERFVFCTPMEGFVRFAGTLELSGSNHRLRPERATALTRAADEYLRASVEGPFSSEWVGLRPCTPDGLPVLGPIPGYRGLYVATGHAMLGLTLGPVTGKLMCEWILNGSASQHIDSLAAWRF